MADSDPLPAVHRDLVEALEGSANGTGIGTAEWHEKVKRAIEASPDKCPRKIGLLIGERYASSVVGRALLVSLELVSAERVWSTILPVISSRLRRNVTVTFEPTGPGVGKLNVLGPRATPVGVTHGVLDFFGAKTRPPTRVEVLEEQPEVVVFELRW